MKNSIAFDTHVHLGRAHQTIQASADELLRSMDVAGIERAMVFAGHINDAPSAWILKETYAHRDRLLAVASVSPFEAPPPIEQLRDWLREGRIHALKFYSGYEYFFPHDEILRPYLQALVDAGRPAIFHSGDTFSKVGRAKLKYARPIEIDELATEMPNLRIIIAHLGFPWVTDTAEVCYKNPNVYTDISGFVYGKFTDRDRRSFWRALRTFIDIWDHTQ